jgi:hypothetical protein
VLRIVHGLFLIVLTIDRTGSGTDAGALIEATRTGILFRRSWMPMLKNLRPQPESLIPPNGRSGKTICRTPVTASAREPWSADFQVS